ncbi:MAG TPA: hypothetical protein VH206_07685 [Xanthobacteraceae bacterium]|nr:hypothetical protein [Xanthobacteraceae bacterium]
MPIDLTAVDWAFVGILSIICFVAALLGSLISFRNKLGGAILAAVLFAVGLVAWMYYPHPQLPGPLAPRAVEAAPVAAPAPAPSAMRPANPVTTVSPPANPVQTVSPPADTSPSGTK